MAFSLVRNVIISVEPKKKKHHLRLCSDVVIVGEGFNLPAHFSPIYFPMGNAATGFFVVFSLIAGVVGVASAISGANHLRYWDFESLPAAASAASIAWTLTLLAMG